MTTQQLDAQVAEMVMGWKCFSGENCESKLFGLPDGRLFITGERPHLKPYERWQPTTDPAQAAEVLKRISPGREITFNQNLKGRWFVTVTELHTGQDWNAEGDTWESVVCLVALEVVG